VGLVGLLLIIAGAYLGSRNPDDHDAWAKSASIALETVGGALIASIVVGFLVDQITRHKLSRETGEQWLWALLGEDTPAELRNRAKEVISHGQAYLSVRFQCQMDFVGQGPDRVLRLRIQVLTDGINHSRSESYLPERALWSMPSEGGHKTRYLNWSYEATDPKNARPVRRLAADPEILELYSQKCPPDKKDFEPDGSLFLYQQEMVEKILSNEGLSHEEAAAGPGERFRLERELEIFLDPTDFFPFFILVPTVGLSFRFQGSACAALAMDARAGGTQIKIERDEDMKKFTPEGALLPGHVVIFSWHPRDQEEVGSATADEPKVAIEAPA